MTGHLLVWAAWLGVAPDFGPPIVVGGLNADASLIAGDFNGDGRADLFGYGGSGLNVVLGDGSGGFGPPTITNLDFPPMGWNFEFVQFDTASAGDFDGDGCLDVVVSLYHFYESPYDGGLAVNRYWQVYLSDGAGGFDKTFTAGGTGRFLPGDLDGNGLADLFFVDSSWDSIGHYYMYLSQPNGGFSYLYGGTLPQLDYGLGMFSPHVVADFNGDGHAEAFAGGLGFGLNLGGGTLQSVAFPPGPWAANSTDVVGGLAADFDADGVVDLLSYGPGGQGWVLLGDGDGAFVSGPISALYNASRAADFNSDGLPDVVSFIATGPAVQLNAGGGAFSPARIYNGAVYDLDVADVNGDAKPDLVTISAGGGVQVQLNDGDWTGAPPLPKLTIEGSTPTEGNSGTTSQVAAFVKLSKPSATPVTVQWTTSALTATPGSDYVESSGTATFAPGQTTQPIQVPIIGDVQIEPTYEYFKITLSGAVGAIIEGDAAQCAIYSEDQPTSLGIANVAKREGNSWTTSFTFTVWRSGMTNGSTTVSYRTVNGTATTSNSDYTAKSGTLSFSPGQTSKTITVSVRGDRRRESDESFYVDLSNPTNGALIEAPRGTGTILNDD